RIRQTGQLGEALIELQRAFATNPGSSAALQELVRTQEMIDRERKRLETTGREAAAAERALTPAETARKEVRDRINRMLPIPELKPLTPEAVRGIKINGQSVKTVFDTIGKVAGLTVLWDPEYQAARNTMNVDFGDMSLEDALDTVATVTKSFWKPLS